MEVREKPAYLGDFRYYILPNISDRTVYQLQDPLLQQERELISGADFENMPMTGPTAAIPNDTLREGFYGCKLH
jgi:hypothetical protein